MTASELNAELYELGAAPEGVYRRMSAIVGIEMCFYKDGQVWSPTSDIEAAIEMAERTTKAWRLTSGAEKSCDHYMAVAWMRCSDDDDTTHADTPARALSLAVRAALVAKKEAE